MKYYSLDKIKATGANFCFIYGGRASGKSYAMAEELLDHYLETGAQFVRVLRSSLYRPGCDTYFTEVLNNNPDKYNGAKVVYDSNRYYYNGEIMGYTIALTLEQERKSNQFPDVDTMVFEEFTAIDSEGYLENELEHFKSLLSTVFRHRSGRVFFIGNSITLSNPYFDAFNIDATKLQPGDFVAYTPEIQLNGSTELGASIALEYVPIGYETASEVPVMMRIPDNEIAVTGAILESDRVHKDYQIAHVGPAFYGIALKLDGVQVQPDSLAVSYWNYNGNAYHIAQTTTGVCFIHGGRIGEEFETGNCFDVWDYDNSKIERNMRCNFAQYSHYMEAPGGDIVAITTRQNTEILFSDQWTEYHYKLDRAEYLKKVEEVRSLKLGTNFGTEEEADAVHYRNYFGLGDETQRQNKKVLKPEEIQAQFMERIEQACEAKAEEYERNERKKQEAKQKRVENKRKRDLKSGKIIYICFKCGNNVYRAPEDATEVKEYLTHYLPYYETERDREAASASKNDIVYTLKQLDAETFKHVARLTAERLKNYKKVSPTN